jgi:hypothetical protein
LIEENPSVLAQCELTSPCQQAIPNAALRARSLGYVIA